jgi:peptidoglycan/xylan/chitin deacetylase (PgdA/CDA1 family)
LRLGRDFLIAMILLVFGGALPFALALTDPRVATIRRLAIANTRPHQPSAALAHPPSTDLPSIATAPAEPVLPGQEQPVQPIAPTIVATMPTLMPIVPTLIPITQPGPAQPIEQNPVADSAVVSPIILMYHYVRSVDAAIDPLGYDLSVTPELFDQHMAWLASNGYTGIRADMLLRCVRREIACPPKPIGITFDDGYADAYSAALPILQRYGFTATFYIVNSFVGQPPYMNWDQLAVLRDAGMEIGSHTIDHLMLTRLDLPEMIRQIAQSRQDLERALGVNVVSFCYPVGDYDATVVEQVRAAGFSFAVTTRWDNNYSDAMTLPRRRVAGGTSVESFSWIITG